MCSPTEMPEVGASLDPHILMRGPYISPIESAGICSHPYHRGLQPPSREVRLLGASPSLRMAPHSKCHEYTSLTFTVTALSTQHTETSACPYQLDFIQTTRHSRGVRSGGRRAPAALSRGRGRRVMSEKWWTSRGEDAPVRAHR